MVTVGEVRHRIAELHEEISFHAGDEHYLRELHHQLAAEQALLHHMLQQRETDRDLARREDLAYRSRERTPMDIGTSGRGAGIEGYRSSPRERIAHDPGRVLGHRHDERWETDMTAMNEAFSGFDFGEEEYQIQMATALSLSERNAVSRSNPNHTSAESSRQGAARNGHPSVTTTTTTIIHDLNAGTRECVVCTESFNYSEGATLGCRHSYCGGCLADFFQRAMTDESIFPPTCCRNPIDVEQHRRFLPDGFLEEFRNREAETGSQDRLYCCRQTCSAFIPLDLITGDVGTCPTCRHRTCKLCKQPEHPDECPEDSNSLAVIQLGQREGWQRCRECRRLVERTEGCMHISCVCGHNFCYRCGGPWPRCECVEEDVPHDPLEDMDAPLILRPADDQRQVQEWHRPEPEPQPEPRLDDMPRYMEDERRHRRQRHEQRNRPAFRLPEFLHPLDAPDGRRQARHRPPSPRMAFMGRELAFLGDLARPFYNNRRIEAWQAELCVHRRRLQILDVHPDCELCRAARGVARCVACGLVACNLCFARSYDD